MHYVYHSNLSSICVFSPTLQQLQFYIYCTRKHLRYDNLNLDNSSFHSNLLLLDSINTDSVCRSSYKEVHVQLGDMNDHSPVFDKEEYHVNIPENALVNTPITKLKVSIINNIHYNIRIVTRTMTTD